MKRRHRRVLELIGLGAALALGAWARVAGYPSVLVHGEVIPQLDSDSSYHLHRALVTVRQFPRVPHFDPLMNWPRGAYSPWADGFDLGAAALAVAAGGEHDVGRAKIAIALWPALLGVILLGAIYRLARVVVPARSWRGGAVAAVVWAALAAPLVQNSSLGRMDHHVAEMLVMVLLTTWALRRLPRSRETPAPPAMAFELEGAAVSGLGVYAFTGTPLYVALACVPLAWSAWRGGRVRGSGAIGLWLGAALSAVLTAPALLEHRRWLAFQYPSLLQPALLALAGLVMGILAFAGGCDSGRQPRRSIRIGVGLAALALLAVLCASPVAAGLRDGLTGWVLHGDPWLAGIPEFLPYFSRARVGTTGSANLHAEIGWSGFALPLAGALAAVVVRTRRARWLLGFTVVLGAMALLQYRYARVLAPIAAVVMGLAIAAPLRCLGGGSRRRRWGLAAPLLALAILVLDQSARVLLPPAPPAEIDPGIRAAIELRSLRLSSESAPGVLCLWEEGHHFEALAEVPVVLNGFGSYLDAAEFWAGLRVFRGSEKELDTYLEEHRVGVVVAGQPSLGDEGQGSQGELRAAGFRDGVLDESYLRHHPLSTVAIAGSAVPGWDVPHLRHLMPRAASPAWLSGLRFKIPYLWTYEVVAGARLRGTARPGARILGVLPFTENHRPHTYNAFARADAGGSWELVLPFPSGYLTPSLRAPDLWSISVEGGPQVRVSVSEAAVRAGSIVPVGRLPECIDRPSTRAPPRTGPVRPEDG